jgi:hypothetical protein
MNPDPIPKADPYLLTNGFGTFGEETERLVSGVREAQNLQILLIWIRIWNTR